MALKARSKIVQNPHAKTQQLAIPAFLVADSQYPFKAGDEVEIELVPSAKRLIIQLARSRKD